MFGFIVAIFKGIFSVLWMAIFTLAVILRDSLEDLGVALFDFSGAWIVIAFGLLVFLIIRILR